MDRRFTKSASVQNYSRPQRNGKVWTRVDLGFEHVIRYRCTRSVARSYARNFLGPGSRISEQNYLRYICMGVGRFFVCYFAGRKHQIHVRVWCDSQATFHIWIRSWRCDVLAVAQLTKTWLGVAGDWLHQHPLHEGKRSYASLLVPLLALPSNLLPISAMSRRPNPAAAKAADKAAANQTVIKSLLKLPGNKVCADCKRNKLPRWASWNLGIFICIRSVPVSFEYNSASRLSITYAYECWCWSYVGALVFIVAWVPTLVKVRSSSHHFSTVTDIEAFSYNSQVCGPRHLDRWAITEHVKMGKYQGEQVRRPWLLLCATATDIRLGIGRRILHQDMYRQKRM